MGTRSPQTMIGMLNVVWFRDRVKILLWDRNGYWLLLKRLEQDRFIWPAEARVPTLTPEQLHWLLEGIDVAVMQRHPQRLYARVS